MSVEVNKTLACRTPEEILSQGKLDVADEIIAPNYVDHDPSSPKRIRGPEGAKQGANTYRSAFPDMQMIVEDQVAEGDKVVTRWRAVGTHQGELMGIPATGKRAEITGISINRASLMARSRRTGPTGTPWG